MRQLSDFLKKKKKEEMKDKLKMNNVDALSSRQKLK